MVKRLAEAARFDLCGIAEAIAGPERARVEEWVRRGYHGSMRYMERRSDPGEILSGCRSVIALGVNYFTRHRHAEGPKVSRYAWGKDYHQVVGGMLEDLVLRLSAQFPGERFVPCCDTSPLAEKAWAERAGIGWIGRNGCLISPRFGSYLFLAEVLTTLPLDPDAPHPDRCGSCDRCLRSCPTDAFVAPGVIDARKCIPYLTIEHRGAIDRPIAPWVFGCDACQEVCPWNSRAKDSRRREFAPRPGFANPDLRAWLRLDRIVFRETFRDSPLTRPRLRGLKRNARSVARDLGIDL